eukprot:sb/3474762/
MERYVGTSRCILCIIIFSKSILRDVTPPVWVYGLLLSSLYYTPSYHLQPAKVRYRNRPNQEILDPDWLKTSHRSVWRFGGAIPHLILDSAFRWARGARPVIVRFHNMSGAASPSERIKWGMAPPYVYRFHKIPG